MRKRILTETEREIIHNFLDKGERTHHFNVVRFRAKKFYKNLKQDLDLLSKVIEKTSSDRG